MEELKQHYLAQLPDIARWVETRDLLAWQGSSLIESSNGRGFVVWSEGDGIGSVVGQVDAADVAQAARVCPELLAFPENIREVEPFLTTFRAEAATIFVASEPCPSFPDYACRPLHVSDAKLLSLVPDSLKDELLDVMQDGQLVVAAFDGRLPVAFSYVASETETLWDVSVDTVETHRRQGYAAAAVATLIGIMKDKGKTAVWGAVHSNLASQSLARKLGFVEADELWVLSKTQGKLK